MTDKPRRLIIDIATGTERYEDFTDEEAADHERRTAEGQGSTITLEDHTRRMEQREEDFQRIVKMFDGVSKEDAAALRRLLNLAVPE